ncbi:hypothetical protein ACJX0J_007860, partial [Zea mays]
MRRQIEYRAIFIQVRGKKHLICCACDRFIIWNPSGSIGFLGDTHTENAKFGGFASLHYLKGLLSILPLGTIRTSLKSILMSLLCFFWGGGRNLIITIFNVLEIQKEGFAYRHFF